MLHHSQKSAQKFEIYTKCAKSMCMYNLYLSFLLCHILCTVDISFNTKHTLIFVVGIDKKSAVCAYVYNLIVAAIVLK